MPGASTIVVFEARLRIAAWSWASLVTLTTAPVGGARAGAGRAGRASSRAAPAATDASRQSTSGVLETMVRCLLETVDPRACLGSTQGTG